MAHPRTVSDEQANRTERDSGPPGTISPAIQPGKRTEQTESPTEPTDLQGECSSTDNTESELTTGSECPVCNGTLTETTKQSYQEIYCEECGYLADESTIDHGPEWRSFDGPDAVRCQIVDKSLYHDGGLGSTISHGQFDETIGDVQRDSFQRTLHDRFKFDSKAERNQAHALREINLLTSQLDAGKAIQKRASYLFQRAQERDIFGTGSTRERYVGAAVYAAYREYNQPILPKMIVKHLRLDADDTNSNYSATTLLRRTYGDLCRELGLQPRPTKPRDYVPFLVDRVPQLKSVSSIITTLARHLHDRQWVVGYDPRGVAAGAAHLVAELQLPEDDRPTQMKIGEMLDITPATIRDRRQDIAEYEPEKLVSLGIVEE